MIKCNRNRSRRYLEFAKGWVNILRIFRFTFFFLLYINIFTEPVKVLIRFHRAVPEWLFGLRKILRDSFSRAGNS